MSRPRCCCCSSRAASAPSSCPGEALYSVGRFPSNSGPLSEPRYRAHWEAPTPRRPGLDHSSSALSRVSFPLPTSPAQLQITPAALTVEDRTQESRTGVKQKRAKKLPPCEARLLHPGGTWSPALLGVLSIPSSTESRDAWLCVCGRRWGLLRRSCSWRHLPLGCWHPKLPL